MQTRNPSRSAARGKAAAVLRNRRLTPLAAAALVLATGAAPASAALANTAGGHAPALTNYRVIQLSPGVSGVDINARGQVGFTEAAGETLRTKFYDGHTIRDIGTLGGTNTIFQALNDQGQITGASLAPEAGGSVYHAYR